jgi:hypothetical protein
MTVALWICSVPLIAEFLIAPFNLWSGRTMPNFVRFTALPPRLATHVFAPVKLLGAILLAVGLASSPAGVAGGAIIALVSAAYLMRLAAPQRQHGDGLTAFGLSLVFAVATIVLQLSR